MERMHTRDGFAISIYVYNSYDYSSHVFISTEKAKWTNSGNSKVYSLHGRDSYETIKKDAPYMTREEVIRMFFKD